MISVIGSLKGGSGKSTLTFNLAVWLRLAEQRILVIDADPQQTLTDVSEVRGEEGFTPQLTVSAVDALGRDDLHSFDQVLIDVGTAGMADLELAVRLADRVVVPVPPSQADIWSTQRFLTMLERMVGDGRRPEVFGFVNRADTHHAVRESDEAAAALVSLPGIRLLRPRLSQRTVYRRSFSEGLAVFELEPKGKGAQEFNRLAAALYADLV